MKQLTTTSMPASKPARKKTSDQPSKRSNLPRSGDRFLMTMMRKTESAKELSLKPYSYSILTALNTCPTWGVVKYGMRKEYQSTARALALEYGSQAHEAFAMIRLWQLGRHQQQPILMEQRGRQLFGDERWPCLLQPDDDPRAELIGSVFKTLHTGSWYDDPADKIRTISNLEGAMINYIDEVMTHMDQRPIYVKQGFIGIEQTLDCILEYVDGWMCRYIGTIDGVTIKAKSGKPRVEENKTAYRLDDAWRAKFYVDHQPTGYMALVSTIISEPVLEGIVHGVKNRVTGGGEDYDLVTTTRTEEQIATWARWVRQTVEHYEAIGTNYEHAPRFTHSCNRYFRPCSLVPFCADTVAGRREQIAEMVTAELSPSELRVS